MMTEKNVSVSSGAAVASNGQVSTNEKDLD